MRSQLEVFISRLEEAKGTSPYGQARLDVAMGRIEAAKRHIEMDWLESTKHIPLASNKCFVQSHVEKIYAQLEASIGVWKRDCELFDSVFSKFQKKWALFLKTPVVQLADLQELLNIRSMLQHAIEETDETFYIHSMLVDYFDLFNRIYVERSNLLPGEQKQPVPADLIDQFQRLENKFEKSFAAGTMVNGFSKEAEKAIAGCAKDGLSDLLKDAPVWPKYKGFRRTEDGGQVSYTDPVTTRKASVDIKGNKPTSFVEFLADRPGRTASTRELNKAVYSHSKPKRFAALFENNPANKAFWNRFVEHEPGSQKYTLKFS